MGSYSFYDDTLGILPWKTRRELIPDRAQGVWLSIRRKLGESYCNNVSEVPVSKKGSYITLAAYQAQCIPRDLNIQLSQNSHA